MLPIKRAKRSKIILYDSFEGVLSNVHVLVLYKIQIDHEYKVKVTKARKVANIRIDTIKYHI